MRVSHLSLSRLITAFAPDKGESVASLLRESSARRACAADHASQGGYLFLDRTKFAVSLAANIEADTASFMAQSGAGE